MKLRVASLALSVEGAVESEDMKIYMFIGGHWPGCFVIETRVRCLATDECQASGCVFFRNTWGGNSTPIVGVSGAPHSFQFFVRQCYIISTRQLSGPMIPAG